MTKHTVSTPAFCLHSRPYRDSSVIAQLFAEKTGRVSVVVKGVKGDHRKGGVTLALLQPFSPAQVSFTGKSDLKTLVAIEADGQPLLLRGQALFAGLYVNELLVRLLAEHMEYPDIYRHYRTVLEALREAGTIEVPLRQFERNLLEQLGYGISFVEVDAQGHQLGELQAGLSYRFVAESGFVRSVQESAVDASHEFVFTGDTLLRIASDDMSAEAVAKQAKQLMRLALRPLLNNKPLNSKLLFS